MTQVHIISTRPEIKQVVERTFKPSQIQEYGDLSTFLSHDDASLSSQSRETDCVILDTARASVISRFREQLPLFPVLIVIPEDATVEYINTLPKIPKSDFWIPPYTSSELLLRVNCLWHRDNQKTINWKKLRLHHEFPEAYWDGRFIALTPKEHSILSYLLLHRGHIISTNRILQSCWHHHSCGEENVAVHICRLRKKIDSKFGIKCIETIPGMGYTIR